MDGETTRVTITAICGAGAVVVSAIIASRTTIITAQIAIKQVEAKERAEAARLAAIASEKTEDAAQEAELSRLRLEVLKLRQEKVNRWQKKK